MPLIRNIPFSYPPILEQQLIVTKLDAANSEFENASESIIKSIIVNNQILNTPPTYIKHLKYLHYDSDRFRREYDVNYLMELRMHNINARLGRINRRLFD